MDRFNTIQQIVLQTLGNPQLTHVGVVQTIHQAHPEIRNVAVVNKLDLSGFTIWVKYHDRESDSFSFARCNLED